MTVTGQKETRMAPGNVRSVYTNDLNISKENNKLRKPIVEKMRRNCINSIIQQLKELLEKEFKRKEPSLRLQIADILENKTNFRTKLQDHCRKVPTKISEKVILDVYRIHLLFFPSMSSTRTSKLKF
ncbi:transcription factor HES-5-like [Protopterus annectens]|uniref:transcription factor HES-5-like n=1 Tax=Protopterus annectens TaxID=7888 RepID=UPI001CFC1B94|nr:transcription factor HES-5-like [Protopterus annectens]